MTHDKGFAPVNGLRMYYEIYGEGIPVVLVHGGGSTIQTSFGNIIPFLAKQHKVIALELQAHGRTSDRDAPESFEQDADDVAGLLGFLKIDKADFLGFSNGGNTIMQVAIRHPQLVAKLVIIAAFYKRMGMMPGFFEGMEQAGIEDMPVFLKQAFLEVNNNPDMLLQMFKKDKQRMLDFRDWTDEDLASIHPPALVVAGDQDVVTAEHTVDMAGKIPGARLLILPGTHGSYIGEEAEVKLATKMPEYTVVFIEDFLSGALDSATK